MTDERALQLLRLLAEYVRDYTPDIPVTIEALAEDLMLGQEFKHAYLLDNIRQGLFP